MRKLIFLCFLGLVTLWRSASAQQADALGDVVVNVAPRAVWGNLSSTMTFSCYGRTTASESATGASASLGSAAITDMPQLSVRMIPGVTYTAQFSVQVSGQPSNANPPQFGALGCRLTTFAPPGYTVQMRQANNALPFRPITQFDWSFQNLVSQTYSVSVHIRLVGPAADPGVGAGMATSLRPAWTPWQLSLGASRSGFSAGTLSFNILSRTASFASTFTRSNLTCDATTSDVLVLGDAADSNVVRQVIAPQVCIDITGALTSGNIQINCYHPSQRSANVDGTGYFTFSGSPFVAYTVQPGASDTAGVTISCDAHDTTTSTVGAVARTLTTTLARSGTSPSYTWTATAWHTGSIAPVQSVRSRSGNTETIDVRDNNSTIALKSTLTYTGMLLDEEITSEQTGTTNSVTTTHDFYTSDPTSTSYGWEKTATRTDGSWQGFEYSGATRTVHGPWKDVSSAGFPSEVGTKTAVTLAPDAFGQLTRMSATSTTTDGKTTAQSSTTYTNTTPFSAFSTHTGLVVVEAAQTVSSSSSASLATKTNFFIENAGDPYAYPSGAASDDLFRGQVHSVERPDKVKQSFIYQRGTWDGSTFTVSPNAGLDAIMSDNVTPASATRTIVVTGSSDSTAGSAYAAADSYPVATVYLVDKKSTLEITIRDQYADLVKTETQIWANSVWNSVSSTTFTYNRAHQLTNRTGSNGAIWSASYSGERKTDETDESGTTVSYAYDAADRIDTATRSAAGSITALTTKFTYDAAGRVTQQTLGYGLAESITTSRVYDDSGRLTSESSPGPNGTLTTSYTYNPAAQQVTVTLPNGGTRIQSFFADGSPKQVTGTAAVAQYFDKSINTGGVAYAKVNVGSAASTRISEAWSDWLGRTTSTSRPGFGGTSQPAFVEAASYDPTTGQLTTTSRTGYADTIFTYDALSQVSRSRVELGGTVGLDLAGPDRVVDADQSFEYISNNWWATKTTKTYPTASTTARTVSTSRQRLTGYSGAVIAESVSIDANGNTTTRTVSVNRATATATVSTSTSGIANSASEVSVNGLLTSATGPDGLTYTVGYDSLGRRSTSVDPRTGTTTTYYVTGTTFPDHVVDASNRTVATYGYDSAGRVTSAKDADNYYTYTSYNKLDQVVRRWGSGTYPVEFAYNSYGERVAQRTFHNKDNDFTTATWPLGDDTLDSSGNPDPSLWTAGDKTTWHYDGPSGLLDTKTDAAGKSVTFTYNLRGQLATRTWARHVGGNNANPLLTTTYNYYSGTGELNTVTYNDTGTANPTSPVTYTYTRAGQIDTVTDGTTGTRTFVYNSSQPFRLDALDLSGFYSNRVLTPNYDGIYRPTGFTLGDTSRGLAADLTQTHTYDATSGRFSSLTSTNSQLSNAFTYGYESNSSLVKTLTSGSFTVTRTFEPNRNLITSIDAKWGTASRSRYDYTYNNRALRDSIKQSGSVFGDFGGSTYYRPIYNGRGEVVESVCYQGEDASSVASPQLVGRRFGYSYDNLGSRQSSTRSLGTSVSDAYGINQLNQYTSRENDVTYVAGTARTDSSIAVTGGTVNGTVARAGRYWAAEETLPNSGGPAKADLTVTATLTGSPTLVRTSTRTAYLPASLQSFSYDEDGNMTGDGVWNYNYDAENRLISMTTTAAALSANFPNRSLEFKYDYLGRRVQKRSVDPTATPSDVYRRYLYDGNNLVAEFDATSTTCGSLVRSYTWGLDLAGSLSATGGVGALLQIHDHGTATDYFPTYDGNGNVTALIQANTVGSISAGTVAAAYEYSPFGELLRCEGSYAKSNPFRFSTKFTDDESGLVYYGQRYYSPSLGRFINRDPIAEQGGLNLYGFCGNDGIDHTDYIGYSWVSSLLKGVGHAISSAGRWIATNWSTVVSVGLNFVPGVGPLLSMAFSTVYGAYTGGIQGALAGLAGSMIGGGIGRGLAGSVISQLGLKGLTAAITQGVITGAFAGAGGAVFAGGNILEGMLIGGISGGIVNGGLYGIEHGALGQGPQKAYQKGSDWVRDVSTRLRNWAFSSGRKGNVSLGTPSIVNDDGSLTPVSEDWGIIGPGENNGASLFTIGDGRVVRTNSPVYGRRVPMTARTTRYGEQFQRLVDSANQRLSRNPELARQFLSDAEIRAMQERPWLSRMAYGNALERMIAQDIQLTPELRGVFEHLGGPNNPDFVGVGDAEGLNFEVTTVKQIAPHLSRPYGPISIVTPYEIPF